LPVSDRLAFLNYIMGSLATTLSAKLNTARVPLKGLRDNEVTLSQKRNIRNGLEHQISRVENSREKGYERRVAELREQLARAERDDEPIERQHEILARKALKESEQEKFQALREVNEQLEAWFTIVSLPAFLFSMERSLHSSHRLLSLSSACCHLFPPRQVSLTVARSRRVLSVLLCSMHWTIGSLAKPLSPRLQMRFWIVPTPAALARLMPQSWSGSARLSTRVSREVLSVPGAILHPHQGPLQLVSLSLLPLLSQCMN
jgi:uncharacterized protein YdcH (DUF465 family)